MDQQSTGQPAEPFNGLTPAHRIAELRAAIVTASDMLSEHRERFLDSDEPDQQDDSLRQIEAHLQGSMIGDDEAAQQPERQSYHGPMGIPHFTAALDPDAAPVAETAELHLLEEVCAFYANDEDRFLKDEGEPYGSIPTEVGLKAREARERFLKREAALVASEDRK